jgi:hypothetical protein
MYEILLLLLVVGVATGIQSWFVAPTGNERPLLGSMFVGIAGAFAGLVVCAAELPQFSHERHLEDEPVTCLAMLVAAGISLALYHASVRIGQPAAIRATTLRNGLSVDRSLR